jgi:hypothetical protein
MNHLKLFVAVTLCAAGTLHAQNNTNPFPTAGNVGIGTGAAQSTATYNLHLHGTADYIESNKLGGGTVNYGPTTRFGMTNTATGTTAMDGISFRLSSANFTLDNRENGNLSFTTGSVLFYMSGSANKIYLGSSNSISSENAFTNIGSPTDNGLFIRTTSAGKYGISIRSHTATDNAIQVMGTSGTTRNFAVKANGEVFARKYTTTLADIPDYVFMPTYHLMPMPELRTFISVNNHLPNIPSAQQYAETGVDLGEMNRLLLEKVEELTLYILQLEERMKTLEEKQ